MRTLLVTLHSKYVHASLALPCLAAACGTECGEVRSVEFTVHEPKEQVLATLLLAEPEVVAFSVYLWNRRASLDLVDALHAAQPELRIVLGGPEVSFEGAELFDRHPGLTALIRGEGEEPFAALLAAWKGTAPAGGQSPSPPPRTLLRTTAGLREGALTPPPAELDTLPSPFAAGRVDLTRGLVYYETSRGCPFACAFCMSALDPAVRSFSMARIFSDLKLLLDAEVPLIKFVDRTFNYDAARARAIWSFILEHNRASRCHFEIGAHLLDAESLDLLATVPQGTFQFEIGVQSTLPATLAAINRRADLDRLETNVRRLRRDDLIPLHLDLIYGLPEEGYDELLDSLDRVAALRPHHLQLEAVKLLPGSPLRRDAHCLGIAFDPHPPYSVLSTPLLDFAALERLRGISRLLDLLVNSGRFAGTIGTLAERSGSLAAAMEAIEGWWRQRELFRQSLSLRELFLRVADFLREERGSAAPELLDRLSRDLLTSERIAPEQAPWFVATALTPEEELAVRQALRAATDAIRGQGIKLQHAAAVFTALPEDAGRTVRLFLYHTAQGQGMTVREIVLAADSLSAPASC